MDEVEVSSIDDVSDYEAIRDSAGAFVVPLIVASAEEANAEKLLSEDLILKDGQAIAGIEVVNPLVA